MKQVLEVGLEWILMLSGSGAYYVGSQVHSQANCGMNVLTKHDTAIR